MNETAQIYENRKQANPNIWEVLKYAIQIFFQYMQYWFLFNISYLGYSLAIITIPSAKISLTAAIWKGLENVDGIKKEDSRKMREYLKENFLKSIQILLIKILVFGIIGFSIWFWISRPRKNSALCFNFGNLWFIFGLDDQLLSLSNTHRGSNSLCQPSVQTCIQTSLHKTLLKALFFQP